MGVLEILKGAAVIIEVASASGGTAPQSTDGAVPILIVGKHIIGVDPTTKALAQLHIMPSLTFSL